MPSRKASGRGLFALAAALIAWTGITEADVVLDGTLGGSSALAGPDFVIDAVDGRTVGTNLFHSFGEFNLTASQSATFTNTTAAPISNVLGRITDTNSSSIDGAIRSVIPNANLFLMNPNGFVFGPNATLDVQGAFHATTSDYIALADGTHFNALPSGADALLTTAAPAAFGFLGSNPGSITIDHSQLAVPQGQTLSLVGGDIAITGTDLNTNNASLTAEGGTINLISVASPGEATFGSPINADAFARYGHIDVTESVIDVSGDKSGDVYIRGGQITLTSSNIFSQTNTGDGGDIRIAGTDLLIEHDADRSGRSNPTSPRIVSSTIGEGGGGAIRITAGDVQLVGGVFVRSETRAAGNGGEIVVNAGNRLAVRDSAQIDSFTFDSGRSGDITLLAGKITVENEFSGSSTNIGTFVYGPFFDNDFANPNPGASGDSGNVTVKAQQINLGPGGRIRNQTWGEGDSGDMVVEANRIILDGDDRFPSTRMGVAVGADEPPPEVRHLITGNAGSLTVKAQYLELREGGVLEGRTFGGGRGADVTIDVDTLITSGDRSTRSTGLQSVSQGPGDAGDLTVTARHIEVRDEAEISTGTFVIGAGAGGNLTVEADTILVLGNGVCCTSISSITGSGSSGKGGNVNVRAREVEVRGGWALISAATTGEGQGGNTTVEADSIRVSAEDLLTPASIDAVAFFDSTGDAGTVTVKAPNIVLERGGVIQALTLGTGKGGDVTVITDNLSVIGTGMVPSRAQRTPFTGAPDAVTSITASSLLDTSGPAGNVTINATNIEIRDGGVVDSITTGPGHGGTVNVSTDNLTISRGSRIDASTLGGGDGGDVNVSANTITLSGEGVNGFTGISAVAEAGATGKAGNITIQADRLESFQGSVSASASQSDGGNITIDATDMVYLVQSSIETAVQGGAGAGGNITIDPRFVLLNHSEISANAFGGPGGNINIQAGNFIASSDSSITASSAKSISGTVVVESPENDIAGSVSQLPQTIIDVSGLLPEQCGTRQASAQSSFVVARGGALAINPDGYLPSFHATNPVPGAHHNAPLTATSGAGSGLVGHTKLALASWGCR